MSDSSQCQLPDFSDEQKNYVVDARASGMSFDEITKHFREVYPDYAMDVPEDVFAKHFGYRIKQILNNSRSSAKSHLEAKQDGQIPINLEAIPLAQTHIRLLCYQRLWDETPVRSLQRVIDTQNGEERVYKNNTRERLAILKEFRRELQLLGLIPASDGGTPTPSDSGEPSPELVTGGGGVFGSTPDADTEQEE